MAQATHDSITRRSLIAGAAVVASTPALAAVPGITSPIDPIFAAIEAHRLAWDELSRKLPTLDEADDEDENAKRELDRLNDAIDAAEGELIDVIPTSIAGIVAVLEYAANHVCVGNAFNDNYVDEVSTALAGWASNCGVPWEVIFHRNLATALEDIASAVQS